MFPPPRRSSSTVLRSLMMEQYPASSRYLRMCSFASCSRKQQTSLALRRKRWISFSWLTIRQVCWGLFKFFSKFRDITWKVSKNFDVVVCLRNVLFEFIAREDSQPISLCPRFLLLQAVSVSTALSGSQEARGGRPGSPGQWANFMEFSGLYIWLLHEVYHWPQSVFLWIYNVLLYMYPKFVHCTN